MGCSNFLRPSLVGDAGQLIHRSPCDRYEIRRAIITTFPAEAIVNATNQEIVINTSIVPGGEFQIIRAGGPDLKDYLYQNFGPGLGLQTGEAVTTPSFDMTNCYFLIHTNGPNYRTRTRQNLPLIRQQLADCYRRCLEEAEKSGATSIAFPCISTGATLGWPRAVAARIGIDTVRRWFNHPIYGGARRERTPGPISFLADPVGPYTHQEDAWLVAFNEFFPASEMPVPPRYGVPKVPVTTRPRRDRQKRATAADRGRGRRMVDPPTLNHEDATLGRSARGRSASPSADSGTDNNGIARRRRRVSERELKDLNGNKSDTDLSPENSRKRSRKPPRRFGQDE